MDAFISWTGLDERLALWAGDKTIQQQLRWINSWSKRRIGSYGK